MKRFRLFAVLPLLAALCACHTVVLNPPGDVARQQGDLVIVSSVLMLLVIVPVMVLSVLFAWRYRQSNTAARYEPDWDHSMPLELVIWAAPLLIIICLGAVTWVGTHLLDPYRPIRGAAAGNGAAAGESAPYLKPLQVEVVALDWKWLFIYPEYGIATVNDLAAPVESADRIPPHLTVGHELLLHSGPRRPDLRHAGDGNTAARGDERDRRLSRLLCQLQRRRLLGHALRLPRVDCSGLRRLDGRREGSGGALGRENYLELARPSENDPARRYASVDPGLYRAILDRCVEPGTMCLSEMMRIDAEKNLAGANAAAVPGVASTHGTAVRATAPHDMDMATHGIAPIHDMTAAPHDMAAHSIAPVHDTGAHAMAPAFGIQSMNRLP